MKPPTMDKNIEEKMYIGRWSSVVEALLKRYATVAQALLRSRIAT
jgi:hypothetical protein